VSNLNGAFLTKGIFLFVNNVTINGGRQFMMEGPSTINRQARHTKINKTDWLIFGGVDDGQLMIKALTIKDF